MDGMQSFSDVPVEVGTVKFSDVVFVAATGKMTGTMSYVLTSKRYLPMARVQTKTSASLIDPVLVGPVQILVEKPAGVMILGPFMPKTISVPFEVAIAPGALVNNAIAAKKVQYKAVIKVQTLLGSKEITIAAGTADAVNWTVK